MKTLVFLIVVGVAIYIFREKIKAKIADWLDGPAI